MTKSGYAKLADFGLAKLDAGASDHSRAITVQGTRQGIIIGTIAYMSPEQAGGKSLDLRGESSRSASCSMNCSPHDGRFAGASDLEVLRQSCTALRHRCQDEIPPALRGIVEKALERDPADRYQSMREMVVD